MSGKLLLNVLNWAPFWRSVLVSGHVFYYIMLTLWSGDNVWEIHVDFLCGDVLFL